MTDHLHIVLLTAPSPADYGGVFDLYYKIPALSKRGIKIILHYFDYKEGRGVQGLERYCEEINAYDRSAFIKSLLTLKPYIVSSRINEELINRLNRDNYPVLLEGIHCTGIMPYINKQKKIIVRMHNNEEAYYKNLTGGEKNLLKLFYYNYDSFLLSYYQKNLSTNATYAFVSGVDQQFFKEKYNLENEVFIPCFLPWQNISTETGKGNYCLYQGNLSVPENIEAVLWLAQNVFSKIDYSFIIAGKNAGAIANDLTSNSKISVVNNPTNDELSHLIKNAQIHVLPSMNSTGVKLKLLHALFNGRFCLSNYKGVAGSGLENAVTIAETSEDWITAIEELKTIEYTNEMFCMATNRSADADYINSLLICQKIINRIVRLGI